MGKSANNVMKLAIIVQVNLINEYFYKRWEQL